MPRTDASEERVVDAQSVEHGTPKQILNVALDDRTVGQGETEPPTFERGGGSDPNQHDNEMLAQRRDRLQGQARSSQLPVRAELVCVEGRPFDHESMRPRRQATAQNAKRIDRHSHLAFSDGRQGEEVID